MLVVENIFNEQLLIVVDCGNCLGGYVLVGVDYDWCLVINFMIDVDLLYYVVIIYLDSEDRMLVRIEIFW